MKSDEKLESGIFDGKESQMFAVTDGRVVLLMPAVSVRSIFKHGLNNGYLK